MVNDVLQSHRQVSQFTSVGAMRSFSLVNVCKYVAIVGKVLAAILFFCSPFSVSVMLYSTALE